MKTKNDCAKMRKNMRVVCVTECARTCAIVDA